MHFKYVLLLLLLEGCAAQQQQPQEVAKGINEKFEICDSEGFMALNMARNYFMSHKNKDSVLNYTKSDAFLNDLAQTLFLRVDSGEIKHHADFAAETLYSCASREQMRLEKPMSMARICYARVDIPFFLSIDKNRGMAKADAIQKVSSVLENRTVYPEGLISAVADGAYETTATSQVRKLMGTVFWSCYYNKEWSKQ